MLRPVVGNFFNSFREFLYEQCSLDMTEKIPSSVKFGSRPRIFLMRSNSPGVRPCCATISGVTIGSITLKSLGAARSFRVALGIDRATLTELGLDTTRSFSRYESNIWAARAVESLKPTRKGH